MILYTSVNASAYRALPKHNELFQFFDGSFLEASKAVPFHTTATHCHHGMDFVDTSFFVLGSELLVCPQFQVTVQIKKSYSFRSVPPRTNVTEMIVNRHEYCMRTLVRGAAHSVPYHSSLRSLSCNKAVRVYSSAVNSSRC